MPDLFASLLFPQRRNVRSHSLPPPWEPALKALGDVFLLWTVLTPFTSNRQEFGFAAELDRKLNKSSVYGEVPNYMWSQDSLKKLASWVGRDQWADLNSPIIPGFKVHGNNWRPERALLFSHVTIACHVTVVKKASVLSYPRLRVGLYEGRAGKWGS